LWKSWAYYIHEKSVNPVDYIFFNFQPSRLIEHSIRILWSKWSLSPLSFHCSVIIFSIVLIGLLFWETMRKIVRAKNLRLEIQGVIFMTDTASIVYFAFQIGVNCALICFNDFFSRTFCFPPDMCDRFFLEPWWKVRVQITSPHSLSCFSCSQCTNIQYCVLKLPITTFTPILRSGHGAQSTFSRLFAFRLWKGCPDLEGWRIS